MSFVSCSANNLSDLDTHDAESIQYSPDKQHALINVFCLRSDLGDSLIFVNLLNRTNSNRICKRKWKLLLHAYWLSNDVISVFTEKKNGHFAHFVYKFGMEETTVQLELIQKTNIPFQKSGPLSAWGNTYQDPCRLQLNGYDFLFVKSYKFILTAFNPLNGPCLPTLNFDITNFVHGMRSQGYYTMIQCLFASYKNSVYIYVSKGKETLFDRILKIDLVDFNLISKKIIEKSGHLDNDNINLIFLMKKTKGLFKMPGFPKIWQNEQFAVVYERKHWPRTTEDKRIIIINLETETVMETVVKFEFSQVTLYNGFLLFWQVPDSSGKVSFKFEWLGENVPTLRDICSVKMLSLPVKNNHTITSNQRRRGGPASKFWRIPALFRLFRKF